MRIVHGTHYQPIVHADDFSLQRYDWRVMDTNTSRRSAVLNVELRSEALGAYRMVQQFEQAMGLMQREFGFSERDTDDVKAVFGNRSLKMLALTYAISILHVIFDFLAFRSDIGFWKGRTDLAGLSRRAVVGNWICSLIIFLYLLDNEATSVIILFSVGSSVVVDAWKVSKVVEVSLEMGNSDSSSSSSSSSSNADGDTNGSGVGIRKSKHSSEGSGSNSIGSRIWPKWLPRLRVRARRSALETGTEQFDMQAMVYLGYVLYPLVGGWAIYSLMYTPHRSWYSWLIGSLANGVYAFGFIMMTPQLFINYKMKSVAHLPWGALTYKAFNTFIDDVFSFIVVMPTMHRLACLRDDLVFFVYLYQRWCYPVDKTRVNEFGYTYAADPSSVEGAGAAGAGAAGAGAAGAGTGGKEEDERKAEKKSLLDAMPPAAAATKIQAAWRGMRVRRRHATVISAAQDALVQTETKKKQ